MAQKLQTDKFAPARKSLFPGPYSLFPDPCFTPPLRHFRCNPIKTNELHQKNPVKTRKNAFQGQPQTSVRGGPGKCLDANLLVSHLRPIQPGERNKKWPRSSGG